MRKALFGMAAFAVLFVLSAGSASAAEGDAPTEMKGSAGCAMCAFAAETKAAACAAAVKVGEKVYTLKCSEKADDATKKLVASFSGAKKATDVTIKGVIKEKDLIADSVVATVAAK
jgi:hypothetical protein